MSTSGKNRVVNTILAIVLVLFASLAAPKLPRNITKYLENPNLRFVIFVAIAYLATQDLVTAVIATIAVLVSYQTLAVQQITDKIMDKTKQMLHQYKLNGLNSLTNMNSIEDDSSILPLMYTNMNNESSEPVMNSMPVMTSEPSASILPINNNVVMPSVNNNVVTPSVNNNVVMPSVNNMYKNTIKYLKGESSEIPMYYDESDEHLGSLENSNTLTESCSVKHSENYACENIPKNNVNMVSGYEEDYDVHASIEN
jgi:hypothetical protein